MLVLRRFLASGARAPAIHFLVLGGLLTVLTGRLPATTASVRPPIVVSAARVAEIRDEYRRTAAVTPNADELAALVAREADEEMLYREAMLLGLDRGDRAIKWRVIEKVTFLYGAEAGGPDAAYARGLALGLDRDDVVVRNAMVTKMRLLAKAASQSDEPTGEALDRELEAYLAAHAADYARAAHVTLTQVFLSAAKRGSALDADAQELLARLRETPRAPEEAARLGDPFVSGHTFRDASRGGLVKLFGEPFADAAAAVEPGVWSDPVRSPYGLHLVRVTAREGASVPPLAAVRPQVLNAYRAERRAAFLTRMMEQLRAAYDVQVERAG